MLKLGCVPYLNAKPLIWSLETRPETEILLAVPSQLPQLLSSKSAEAILVSSIEALRTPGVTVADGVSISSFGPVRSVRLFSRVPFPEIQTLALDASSLTSNALAQIILAESYGIRPETIQKNPDIDAMLSEADACILIGDNGLKKIGETYQILDLGEAWTHLTGLPFVWAVWTGSDRLTHEVANTLREARERGQANLELIAEKYATSSGQSKEEALSYLTEAVQFELGPNHHLGLEQFARFLVKNDILRETFHPVFRGRLSVAI
ncbi:MAG: menaquinone biosynthesis protein [Armatimonadetes bacterium]|nr:menaquinone biosynthesis protein [Armatimonadota bacterium]